MIGAQNWWLLGGLYNKDSYINRKRIVDKSAIRGGSLANMCFKLFLCVFLSRKLYSVLYNIILIFVFFRFVYFIKKNMCFVCFVCGKNVFLSKINTALKPDRFRKT